MIPKGGHRRRRISNVHKSSQKLDDVRNEINVTPLVDVCLVLLIIMMVIGPMLARGKEVPLPETRHHSKEADKNQPIVAIDIKGQLYFDKELVPDLETLKKRVEDAWRASGSEDRRVFVKADAELTYKKVYPLIIAVHELGVPGVDLGTTEVREKK
jgi:biopolymer transport protein ExbD